VIRQEQPEEGTAVTKKYQMGEGDMSRLHLPEQVNVAMTQIAADVAEGLLALAVGAGLQVMGQLICAPISGQ
jgi:putative transposase